MAIERFNSCGNIVTRLMSSVTNGRHCANGRKQLETDEVIGDPVPVNAREGKLRKELGYTKRLLAEKAMGRVPRRLP